MNATDFYRTFEAEFAPIQAAMPQLRRLAGKTSKWRQPLPNGSLLLAFATSFRTAGLLPHMPAEFALKITWVHGKGTDRHEDYVSLFQYTTEAEGREYASLQRAPLEKFLRQPGKGLLREIFSYASDLDRIPLPNIEEYHYCFDANDAQAWGRWYATILPVWTERFASAPESNEDWAWRVLWPHLERRK